FGNILEWDGTSWQKAATSSLKILTDDTIEGTTNLFYTATRFNASVNGSTTIANASGVTSGNVLQWNGTKWVSVATTTLGILNPESYINGSSTVAHAGNAAFGNTL